MMAKVTSPPLVAAAAAANSQNTRGSRPWNRVSRDSRCSGSSVVAVGAVDDVERAIDDRVAEALTVLDTMPISRSAHAALGDLARFVAWRDR